MGSGFDLPERGAAITLLFVAACQKATPIDCHSETPSCVSRVISACGTEDGEVSILAKAVGRSDSAHVLIRIAANTGQLLAHHKLQSDLGEGFLLDATPSCDLMWLRENHTVYLIDARVPSPHRVWTSSIGFSHFSRANHAGLALIGGFRGARVVDEFTGHEFAALTSEAVVGVAYAASLDAFVVARASAVDVVPTSTGSPSFTTTSTEAVGWIASVAGVVVFAAGRTVRILGSRHQTKVWSIREADTTVSGALPLAGPNTICFVVEAQSDYVRGLACLELEPDRGLRARWIEPRLNVGVTPLVIRGHTVLAEEIGSNGPAGSVVAREWGNGTVLWSRTARPAAAVRIAAAGEDGHIIFHDGRSAWSLDPRTGIVAWEVDFTDSICGPR